MLDNGAAQHRIAIQHQIALGDPVPWFSAATVTGASFHLQVAAGRWIVLCFLGPADGAQARQKLAELLRDADLFDEDRLTAHVFTELVGLQMLLMGCFSPLLQGQRLSPEQYQEIVRAVQSGKGKRAKELLTQRLGLEEK